MEYIVGAIIAGIVLFIFKTKGKVNDFNKMCLLDFPSWHSVFLSSAMPEKYGIARAFLLQSLHLAENTGVISAAEKTEIELELRAQNPIETVNSWLDSGLPHIKEVCGEQQLSDIDARLAGVFILVCLSGFNPRGDLIKYIKKLNSIDSEHPKSILGNVDGIDEKSIVSGYRRIAAQQGCAPTARTSDKQIIQIYKTVANAFQDVSDQRGEHLSEGILNHIVLKFLNVNELLGDGMLEQHLDYEIQKYRQEGLRPDYRQNLQLF